MADSIKSEKMDSVGDYLRFWRRIRKISQMDLAFDAGVSSRHLSFVETGRSKPSRDLVLKMSHALKLTLRHRNTLLTAAGYAPEYGEEPFEGENMEMVRYALQRILSKHDPYPSVVMDSAYNLLMRNKGFEMIADHFLGKDALDKYDNIYRLTFAGDGLSQYIKDWPVIEQFMIARLWDEAVSSQNEKLIALHQEIINLKTHDEPVRFQMNHTLPMMSLTLEKDDIKASFFTMITTLGTPLDLTTQELRIESLFPVDNRTKKMFR